MQIELTRWNNGQQETITVEIDATGNIKATVEGVMGPVCGEISQFLDDMGQVTMDEPTGDFYQTTQSSTTLYGQG